MRVEAFAEPFRHWLLDGVADPALCRLAHDSLPPPTWPGWVRYRNELEWKRTSRELGALGDVASRLFDALVAPATLAALSALVGVPLRADPCWHGAGVHVLDPGDFLMPHLDYALHPTLSLERRASLILFLTPDWREEWGGDFELLDEWAKTPVKCVRPAFGRAVLFENGDLAYHSTGRTAADAPPRVTAACYYLAEPRPGCIRRRSLFVPRR